MTSQHDGAPIDDPASSTCFTFTFLYPRNISDIRESECEVSSLVTALNEPISTLNDIFGSKKEKFVFVPRTISLAHVQDVFIMYSQDESESDFIYVHKVHQYNALLRENT